MDHWIDSIRLNSPHQWKHYADLMVEAARKGNKEMEVTANYFEVWRQEASGIMSREEATHRYIELAGTAYREEHLAQALYLLFHAFENYRLHLHNYDMMFKLSVAMKKIISRVPPHTFPPLLWYRLEIGNMYYHLGDDEMTLRMIDPILDTPRIAVTVGALAPTYNLIGLIHMKHGRYRKARHTFTLITERENLSQQSSSNKTYWNAVAQGNIGNAYLLDRQYDKAIPLLKASIDSIVSLKDYRYACGRTINLAETYIMKHNAGKAWRYIKLAEEYNGRAETKRDDELYAVKAKYYALIGETDRAFHMRDSADIIVWESQESVNLSPLIEQMEEDPLSIFETFGRSNNLRPRYEVPASGAAFAIVSICSLFALCFYQPASKALKYIQHIVVKPSFPPRGMSFHRVVSRGAPPLSDADAILLYNRAVHYMENEHPYLQADFTLPKLCDALKVSRSNLSYCINQVAEKNFNEFVNQYRVRKAICLLEETGNQYSIDAISTECGFRDRSTFYRTFKKETGYAPSEYVRTKVTNH
ncbi:MAG: helix-turn-helix domain-containing protein [Mediterranea sp.]|nr:helix-turn-helix domain-containing protein [Mediterranea sp.]